jgi:hypothetical protein
VKFKQKLKALIIDRGEGAVVAEFIQDPTGGRFWNKLAKGCTNKGENRHGSGDYRP